MIAPRGATALAMAMSALLLTGCTGEPQPVVTVTVTAEPTAAAEAEPSPTLAPAAAESGDVFESGVGYTITATQTADESTDAAGNAVSYDPMNIADGDPDTAWRKSAEDWSGDDYLLVTFDEPMTVSRVGLVNGYAKVDASSGTDRYLQNHRLCWATFELSDGSAWSIELDTEDRTMQSIPVAGTVDWVRITDLYYCGTEDPEATRDFIAISDVEIIGKPA
ncbi:NADase-type glycan-binding domain-containing protein [Demequina rhizosphaerae]|uniref:NADase-type glycan-binding domain-containing protein n=1 Tax=Demequina rhizosphaerae TaxID=1638985 RepID=UPI0007837C91|nr:hypothetical protein [Demequina rhizosphaerae]